MTAVSSSNKAAETGSKKAGDISSQKDFGLLDVPYVLQDLSQDLDKLSRSCHGLRFAMIRSYQESHVTKKIFL